MPEGLSPFPYDKEEFDKKQIGRAENVQTERQSASDFTARFLGLETWEQAQARIERYQGYGLEQREFNWVKFGSIPVCFWAPHALAPTSQELEMVKLLNLKSVITTESLQEWQDKIKDRFDAYTGPMVSEAGTISDQNSATILVSNRPRVIIDQGRRLGSMGTDLTFPIKGKEEKSKIPIFSNQSNTDSVSEYFDLLQQAVERTDGLIEGKAARPFLVIALHGMANHRPDRPGAEIIIGARDYRSAHQKVVNWFMQRFQRLLDDSPLLSGTIIAFQKSGRRNLPGNRVLEIHRQGDENIVFSGLGEGMQVLQIEIVALIRKNPKRRQALVAILRQIAQEFAIIFPTLESLV